VIVVFCKAEISELDRTLVKGSIIERGESECDRGDLIMRKTWPTRGCCAMERGKMSSYKCLGLIRNSQKYGIRRSNFFGMLCRNQIPYYLCFEGSFCLHLQVLSAQLFSFDCLTLKMKEINPSKIGKYTIVNRIYYSKMP